MFPVKHRPLHAPGGQRPRTAPRAGLRNQVHSLLATSGGAATARSPGRRKAPSVHTDQMDSSPNTRKGGTAVAVPSCVKKGIGHDASPLAAQQGTYNGAAAFLVVLPYPSDTDRVEAYGIDTSCVDATPPARSKVLLTHTYPHG
jgi:hypothetical protein